ncbi:MAG: GNAT family N-acetyltransferase [Actinomycetota bacterium]|jgi:RimJ/RimL family protein N-acetyltransferase|nr:GNAT family N-acetyltransferase [Rubrobacter sp.]MDQ3509581.1 GNAT family N-acetyltransferase [Actinomycetota bacterium]
MNLETKRLHLRPFALSDLDVLADICARPDTRGFAWEGPKDRSSVAAELREWIAEYENGLGSLAIIYKEGGELIGHVGVSREEGRYVLSYALRKDHWCMGLAPEACRKIMAHTFDELEMDEIWTRTRAGNSAWRSMMGRLGMTHRESAGDTVHYAATAGDFSDAMREHERKVEFGMPIKR